MKSIELILARTSDLPTIPTAVLSVIQATKSSDVTAGFVAAEIAKDQSLAIRILRLANSSFYGMSRKVSTIQEAVVILGFRTIRNLALVASSYAWMSKELAGYRLSPSRLWKHSLASGIASKTVAEKYELCDPEIAFAAGLLQNIGMVALSLHLDEHRGDVFQEVVSEEETLTQRERSTLGCDHAELGARLGQNWGLPSDLVNAIQFHHQPDACPTGCKVAGVVYLGGLLAEKMNQGLGLPFADDPLNPLVVEQLGFRVEELEVLADDSFVAFERFGRLMGEVAA